MDFIICVMLKKISKKKIVFLIFIILVVAAYFVYRSLKNKNKEMVTYEIATIGRGTLVVSVSGSGQVNALNQIDVKPKGVSGDVVSIEIKQGQTVKANDILVVLDTTDAQKAMDDAETSLETANLQLEELLSPPDELTVFQAEDSLTQAKNSLTKLKLNQKDNYQKALQVKQKAIDDVTSGYEDAFNTVETVFFNAPTVMTALWEILYDDTINKNQLNVGVYEGYDYSGSDQMASLIEDAKDDYGIAETKYTPNLASYKKTSRYASQSEIELLLSETLETVKAIAQAIKSEKNVIDYAVDYLQKKGFRTPTTISAYQSSLSSYLTQINTYYSNLLSRQQAIKNSQDALINAERDLTQMQEEQPLDLAAAERSVEEKEKKLADLLAGADDLDIRAQKITVKQKEDALAQAKKNLANYFIRASFDGVVADIGVKENDSVSSGTALLTLITPQKIVKASFNEIDVAQIKVGQKATVTFDAAEDLTVAGEVVEIDTVGAVSQGVVTYNIKVAFDTQDERVKPGMSASVSVITNVRQDILLVPNAAVKGQGEMQYVEILNEGNVLRQPIGVGVSNDLFSEVIDGIEEGAQVITGQNSSSSTSSSGKSSSGSRNGMPSGGGMEFMRIMR